MCPHCQKVRTWAAGPGHKGDQHSPPFIFPWPWPWVPLSHLLRPELLLTFTKHFYETSPLTTSRESLLHPRPAASQASLPPHQRIFVGVWWEPSHFCSFCVWHKYFSQLINTWAILPASWKDVYDPKMKTCWEWMPRHTGCVILGKLRRRCRRGPGWKCTWAATYLLAALSSGPARCSFWR